MMNIIKFNKNSKRWELIHAGHKIASSIRLNALTRHWPDAEVRGK